MIDNFYKVFDYYTHGRTGWYHNIDHIIDLIKAMHDYKVSNYKLYTAILFHDLVYNIPEPGKKLVTSNELASAKKYIELVGIINYNQEIYDMIRVTEYHFSDMIDRLQLSFNEKWILDLDILGFSEPDFNKFLATQKRIDKEYLDNGYTQEQVDKGRYEFLLNIFNNKLLQYRIIPDREERTKKAYENIGNLLDFYAYSGKIK